MGLLAELNGTRERRGIELDLISLTFLCAMKKIEASALWQGPQVPTPTAGGVSLDGVYATTECFMPPQRAITFSQDDSSQSVRLITQAANI
jgi:hypothetical protein